MQKRHVLKNIVFLIINFRLKGIENMNTYIVTLRFNGRIITREYEFSYSIDAVNTMLDDQMEELNNLKTGFSLTCIVKKD